MCGIVGLAGFGVGESLADMLGAIVHRGPDDGGSFVDSAADVAIAMRRLSIIDLAGGHQPMANEDRTIWIVLNGEIFNAPELRPGLVAQGHRFRTANSDTEVLLHLYEEKGIHCLDEVNGMFAFVIYDQQREILFGARDRMGIKPLYYWHNGGRFACASELKSLLQIPQIERRVNLQSLYHYLTLLYVPDEASIIERVNRLPPAHRFVFDVRRRQLIIEQYWHLRFDSSDQHNRTEWAELLRQELRQAVSRWTLSDVQIACSLSGGVDSTAIVGLLAEVGYPKIKTFTLGFLGAGERAWDESERARRVAQHWGTDHHEFVLHPDDLLNDLVRMVWHLDEPYAGGLPSWYVFREMSKHVKVGLTGTGGDELFGNYGKFCIYEQNRLLGGSLDLYKRMQPISRALAWASTPLAAMADRLPSAWRWIGRGRVLSQLPEMLREPFGHYYYANTVYLSDKMKQDSVLLAPQQEPQRTASYLQQRYDVVGADELRNGLMAVDMRTQLAEEFLFMTDRFSMAHSLEARVPLLDHKLVELVCRIPAALRTREDNLKYLFKQAVSDLLPPELLASPKSGFVIPVELWLRGSLRPLVQRMLSPERLDRQGIFAPQFYNRWVQPHLDGRAIYTWQIWAALMFQLWHTVFIEQNCHATPDFDWRDLT